MPLHSVFMKYETFFEKMVFGKIIMVCPKLCIQLEPWVLVPQYFSPKLQPSLSLTKFLHPFLFPHINTDAHPHILLEELTDEFSIVQIHCQRLRCEFSLTFNDNMELFKACRWSRWGFDSLLPSHVFGVMLAQAPQDCQSQSGRRDPC